MSKTNTGLVEYAVAQLGKPYWYGTFGQTANSGLLAAKRLLHGQRLCLAVWPEGARLRRSYKGLPLVRHTGRRAYIQSIAGRCGERAIHGLPRKRQHRHHA